MSGPPGSSRQPYRTAPRLGSAASTRNFGQSSAGGGRPAATLVGTISSPPPPRFAKGKAAVGLEAAGLGPGQLNKVAHWGESYVRSEDSIRNDYSTRYVQTGERPQNHLRGADVAQRFAEYPKLAALLQLKHGQLASPHHSIPPTYSETEVTPTSLADLAPHRFDVILISPPASVTFEELRAFDLGKAAATPGFVWLWVGSGQKGDGVGLEKGRELLSAWGYRRCEDIVWLKTNKSAPANDLITESPGVFTPTVEHCLMGIRGTVRRSNDPWFVHCNVDTDVLVWEGDSSDPELKPPELQSLIENFCLGTRRLHLFGSPHSLRRGWLTVGPSFQPLAPSPDPGAEDDPRSKLPIVRAVEGEDTAWGPVAYEKDKFGARFARTGQGHSLEDQMRDADLGGGGGSTNGNSDWVADKVLTLLPYSEELDALRPKSPPPRNGQPSSGGLGRGRGAGLGVTRSAVLPNGASSSRGSRGPPSNRGPPPPDPNNPYQQQYPQYQQNFQPQYHHHPPPPFPSQQHQPYFQPYNPAFPPPSSNQNANPYGFDPHAPPFVAQNHQLAYQNQQQQALFQQWLAMGGASMGMGGGHGGPGQWQGPPPIAGGNEWHGQGNGMGPPHQYPQHYSPNLP